MQGMGLDGGNQRDSYASKSNSSSSATKESTDKPKKMTWATIASQPVKSSQTRVSSTLKKKPGMPPPPMIPGKHDISWDTDKNGSQLVPPPVPSPPPIIDDGPSPFQFQPQKNNSTSSANNTNAQQSNNAPPPPQNRNGDRYRDDRGPITRERDERGPITRERDNRGPSDSHSHEINRGFRGQPNNQNNRYQPHHRSNYNDRPNQERPNYNNDNPRYQPRQSSYQRPSPPSYQSHSNGPNRNYGENVEHVERPERKIDVEQPTIESAPVEPEPIPEKLLDKTNYNPPELDTEKLDTARYFRLNSKKKKKT